MSWLRIPTTPKIPWYLDPQQVIRPQVPQQRHRRYLHNSFSSAYAVANGGLFESFYSLLLFEYIVQRQNKLKTSAPTKVKHNLKLFSSIPNQFKSLPYLQGLGYHCPFSSESLKDYPCPIIFAEPKSCIFNLLHNYQEVKNKYNIIVDQFPYPRASTLRSNMVTVIPFREQIQLRNLEAPELKSWALRNLPMKFVLVLPELEPITLFPQESLLFWTPQDVKAFQQMISIYGFQTVVMSSQPQKYRDLPHSLDFSVENFFYLANQAKFILSKTWDLAACQLAFTGGIPLVDSRQKEPLRQLSSIRKYHSQPLLQIEKMTPALAAAKITS